jgi:hypothetical protein
VARFAVGDAGPAEHEAMELVRRCSECAALAADITTISKSVARMPTPPRPRDFRMTREQADQLRGSRIDRWLRTITGSGWSTVRPVAAVALSVGMVMSVVGFLPVLGAAVGTPSGTDVLYGEAGAGQQTPQMPEASANRGSDVPAPVATAGQADVGPDGKEGVSSVESPYSDLDNAYLQATTVPEGASPPDAMAMRPGTGPSVRDVVLVSGLSVTIAALIVLALLYAARRRYYDPLLR